MAKRRLVCEVFGTREAVARFDSGEGLRNYKTVEDPTAFALAINRQVNLSGR